MGRRRRRSCDEPASGCNSSVANQERPGERLIHLVFIDLKYMVYESLGQDDIDMVDEQLTAACLPASIHRMLTSSYTPCDCVLMSRFRTDTALHTHLLVIEAERLELTGRLFPTYIPWSGGPNTIHYHCSSCAVRRCIDSNTRLRLQVPYPIPRRVCIVKTDSEIHSTPNSELATVPQNSRSTETSFRNQPPPMPIDARQPPHLGALHERVCMLPCRLRHPNFNLET